ncbi:glycoside hydrolase family 27 protein [Niabella insulamsoli]|uniref:glycoside hydrolase family 27 protein n=1 Tax=Niabella insulamsoli TaxID=3144874 RepID=UPI0031FC96C6
MVKGFLLLGFICLNMVGGLLAQPRPPMMGWSSWNEFRIHINEKMIREQADAMIATGLHDAGYQFVNIDDGYFGGREASGKLFVEAKKFPSGMAALTSYIHHKGLKTGIYTDAGKNTCGSIWDKDPNGFGVGIYGHVEQDCQLFFKEWGFDFLKVDWCGGEKMKLDEQTEYTKIIKAVKAIDPAIGFNICRWQFPGEWAIRLADSWRMSHDIGNNFKSILKIIDQNADLYQYASPGHYNDMDILQVGRGMTYEEDKTHFSMWCMLNSPLMAGNDLRKMTDETLRLLTNKELIAINQDISQVQARRVFKDGHTEVWMKRLKNKKEHAIAILNRSDKTSYFTIPTEKLGLKNKYKVRDLWKHQNLGRLKSLGSLEVAGHGVVILKVY